jgi:hypothetical protein
MRPFVPLSQLIRSQLQEFGGGVVRVGDLVAGTDERTIRRPSHVVFRPFPLANSAGPNAKWNSSRPTALTPEATFAATDDRWSASVRSRPIAVIQKSTLYC